jgi:hypothetical protein
MSDWFHLGGFAMWVTLLFGALMIAAAARYASRPVRQYLPVAISLGVMTLLSGAFGFAAGVARSMNGLPDVSPDRRWIWLVGCGESLVNMAFALGLIAIATFAIVVGTWRIARQAEI